jgi:hypothetical protein
MRKSIIQRENAMKTTNKIINLLGAVLSLLATFGLTHSAAAPPEGWVLQEELTVPADLPNGPVGVYSSTQLLHGETYYFEVEGSFWSGEGECDAKYARWVAGGYPDWVDVLPHIALFRESLVELLVDEQRVDWGPFNEQHVYHTFSIGAGASVRFRIDDFYPPNDPELNEDWYFDNRGGLSVRIYSRSDGGCPNASFAEDAIIWHQPLARNGASEDTDPSASRTVKYRFKRGSTIPIQIHALGCTADVTPNPNVIGSVAVFGDSNCAGATDANPAPIDFNGVGGGGGVMDKVGGHLKYNLDTKTLPTTTQCYILRVTVTDTSTDEEVFEEVLLQAK